jgi:RNA polymerase sigma factor (TIGR02999 family)
MSGNKRSPPEPHFPGDITNLLDSVREGNRDALDALFPIVYAELRSLACRQLRAHRRATLSTTAVVHEAYLKLIGSRVLDAQNRMHFFSIAARAMRQILVDHARLHLARKRGLGAEHVELDHTAIQIEDRAKELVDLDRALGGLQELDERLSRVVEVRFFAGLSVEETAELLDVSPRTIKRDWRRARAYLFSELHGGSA